MVMLLSSPHNFKKSIPIKITSNYIGFLFVQLFGGRVTAKKIKSYKIMRPHG